MKNLDVSFQKKFISTFDNGPNSSIFQSEIENILNLPEFTETGDSEKPDTNRLILGLALSGGGIRSATFNLGLLQALCRVKLMKRVNYLSTVSGGGFIGSCLTTLLNSKIDSPDLLSIEGFPFSDRSNNTESKNGAKIKSSEKQQWTAGIEKKPVNHLRYHSNYLTAANTLIQKYIRPAMVFLRSMILNFLTVVPYLMALAIFLAFFHSCRTNFDLTNDISKWLFFDLPKFETALKDVKETTKDYRGYVLRHTAHMPVSDFDDRAQILKHKGWLHKEMLEDLGSNIEAAEKDLSDEWLPVWLGPLLIFLLMIISSMACLAFFSNDYDERFESSKWLGLALLFSGTILLINLYGTILGHWRHWSLPSEWGFVSLLSLLAPKLLLDIAATSEKANKPWVKISTSIVLLAIVPVMLLFLIGIVIFILVPVPDPSTEPWPFLCPLPGPWLCYLTLIGIAAIIFIASAVCIDINRISLHNFYRDRLSKAYLIQDGGGNRIFDRLNHIDKQNLSGLAQKAPYHLINVNLNLTKTHPFPNKNSDNNTQKNNNEGIIRNGENFIFSKEWCGSEKTGYRKTDYYQTRDSHLDLGTAMAISGAAANVGMGLIKLPILRPLMGLLNIRLGYWAPNPNKGPYEKPSYDPDGSNPGHGIRSIDNIFKSWQSILEWFSGYKLDAKFINLSDGGHFENLGVYELLRRRCKYIIVGDAEADPQMSFGALSNLIRLARIDFGIRIDIDISDINPDSNTGNSRKHCAVGIIQYPKVDGLNDERGYMLYCKSSMTGDEPQHLQEYRAKNSDFPHESTADQWFDERQFEMYRELGFHIGTKAFSPCSSDWEKDNVEKIFWELKRFWHPHSSAVEKHFSKHGKELNSIISQIKDDEDLSFLDAQIYPEWEALIGSQNLKSPPPNLWLPDDEAVIRKGFYMCGQMINLMENVYLDLDLENTHEHPDNVGWMNLFMHWSSSGMFRLVWGICACNFGEKFKSFCERRLKLSKATEVELDPITKYLELKEVNKTLKLKESTKKSLSRRLNPVEMRKIESYLAALKNEPNSPLPDTCYALKLSVKDRFNSNCKKFGIGFVLTSEKKEYWIHYMRIQDHLRKMGLGHESLERLIKRWMKEGLDSPKKVGVIADNDFESVLFQEELMKTRKIFNEMIISVQAKLIK